MISVNFGLKNYEFDSMNDVCRWLKNVYKTLDGSFSLEVDVHVAEK